MWTKPLQRFKKSAKLDPLSALIFCHRSDALCAGDGGFQFFEQCIRILRSNRHQQATCRLRVIQQILLGKLRITSIHTGFRKSGGPVKVVGPDSGGDPEGEALTFTVVRGPKRGSVEMNADGTFTYTYVTVDDQERNFPERMYRYLCR